MSDAAVDIVNAIRSFITILDVAATSLCTRWFAIQITRTGPWQQPEVEK